MELTRRLKFVIVASLCFVLTTAQAQRGGRHNGYYKGRPPVHRGGNVRVVQVVPHRAYMNMPRRGSVVRIAPAGATVITMGPARYHYYHGVYYKPYRTGFVVVPPPIGLHVAVLPPSYISLHIGPRPYYYYYGAYYAPVSNGEGYETVPPPVGARVDALPEGYEKVLIDGMTYYNVDGTFYKTVVDEFGEVKYEVVGQQK